MTEPDQLLTKDEHAALNLTAQLIEAFNQIIGDGPSATGDAYEVVGHIHALQHMILAQAAARAYPERYRLLGRLVKHPETK